MFAINNKKYFPSCYPPQELTADLGIDEVDKVCPGMEGKDLNLSNLLLPF